MDGEFTCSSVRELSATRQRRLWRPTDDWEMGMMTDGCDGRERMSWRSFPASPCGPLHCCELVTRMPHSESLGEFRSSLECKARPVFLNSRKTRFTGESPLSSKKHPRSLALPSSVPLQVHRHPRRTLLILTSSPASTRHIRHPTRTKVWLSRHTRPLSSQASNHHCRFAEKTAPFPILNHHHSHPTRQLASLQSHDTQHRHTYIRSPRPSPQTTGIHPRSSSNSTQPRTRPEPETRPPRTHHHFFVPAPNNRRQPSHPPPPTCPKPTSASAKTTRASTSSRQRCLRSAA